MCSSDLPLNVCDFVLTLSPTFVARGFASNVDHLTDLIQQALHHDGFAFIEVLQQCPTFNKATPQEWYWNKLVDVKDMTEYDNTDIWQARKVVQDMEEKIAVGLIYQSQRPNFLSLQSSRKGQVETLANEVKAFNISTLLQNFML